MAFTAVETTRITAELMVVLAESCPTVKQVFLDGSSSFANNQTDLKAIVDTVTTALFNQTAPTKLP
jgi:hypothetical protein